MTRLLYFIETRPDAWLNGLSAFVGAIFLAVNIARFCA